MQITYLQHTKYVKYQFLAVTIQLLNAAVNKKVSSSSYVFITALLAVSYNFYNLRQKHL